MACSQVRHQHVPSHVDSAFGRHQESLGDQCILQIATAVDSQLLLYLPVSLLYTSTNYTTRYCNNTKHVLRTQY